MEERIKALYEEWLASADTDADLKKELEEIRGNEEEINDRFYKELEFGTAGLRGVIGAGTNRMNLYTVGRATRGFADYLLTRNPHPSVAIAYDSRNKSTEFSEYAAAVMASKGIKVYIWPELMPTPMLSYAVRYYKCDGGIMITASHNPAIYNGYKVYDETGCQLADDPSAEVTEAIEKIPMFEKSETPYTYCEGIKSGMIKLIPHEVFDTYISRVAEESFESKTLDRSVAIVYTPLNGTGRRPVMELLDKMGYTNVKIVKSQEKPDGNFPTCPYPNPEMNEALAEGLKVAKEENADILIATDPDADRLGVAVNHKGEFRRLTGNEVGLLLLDYIAKRRIELGKMPANPVTVKTVVSSNLIDKIAARYGVEVKDVLTGFKYIGGVIKELEDKGEDERYIFGFEESCGYLTSGYVRDKDAVDASLMVADMFAYYKSLGMTFVDALEGIYKECGYNLTISHSYAFPGESGFAKMQGIMEDLRKNPPTAFAGIKVVESLDYSKGINGLPKSNVLKYILEGGSMVVVRPSGTEPKIKLYEGINADSKEEAEKIEKEITDEVSGSHFSV